MSNPALTVFIPSAPALAPIVALETDPNRVAFEVFNDGTAGSAFLGVYYGDSPDLSKPVAIVLPFSSYVNPPSTCVGAKITVAWQTLDAGSKGYVTAYAR